MQKWDWLKLNPDYFDRVKIKKLRKTAGGEVFIIIYLKLQLMSLKSGGILRYKGVEKSFVEELSLCLGERVEDIKMTLIYLEKVKLIEMNEDRTQFILPEAIENAGCDEE